MNVSELHLLIDWSCHFPSLENEIKHPLELIKKIQMKKLTDKKKVMSEFYNIQVDDSRGETDFNVYIIRDTNPNYKLGIVTDIFLEACFLP